MLFVYSITFFIPIIYCQTVYEFLNSFKFLNEGLISSSDIYQYQYEYAFYTEPENATRAGYAWAEGPIRSYLYQIDPSKPLQCNSNTYLNQTNLHGANFISLNPPLADPSHCTPLCCSYMSCVAWVYTSSASEDSNECRKGQVCCYLKSYVPPSLPSTTYISAIMNRTFPYKHLSVGMRSSVPLGGIITGSIELRGDGTFHEWTIENQSPATGTKYGLVDNSLLAFRIKNLQTNQSDTRLIRTHPNQNFKGIQTIKYHGSYPISKLQLIDNTLMGNIDLYVYSIFKPADLNRSITPAIIFSLNIENSNNYPINIDFMYNAPLSAQIDQTRQSNKIIQEIINDQSTCVLYNDVQYNQYLSGFVSGILGEWVFNKTGPLVLNRLGNSSSNDEFVLWPFLSSDQTMTATINNDINNILNDFERNGGWFNQTEIEGAAMNGAVSISTMLNPGEKKLYQY